MNLKQILCISLAGIILLAGIIFMPTQATTTELTNDSFLRIHIRANSNDSLDQQVKYKVKDEIVTYLTPILSEADSKEKAMCIIKENLEEISKVASLILSKEGYNYAARAKLTNEYFPTRCYDNVILNSGEYDSLILELGTGTGNNWWCVMYPPLCFVTTNPDNSEGVVYKSKILEIIKQFFGGK